LTGIGFAGIALILLGKPEMHQWYGWLALIVLFAGTVVMAILIGFLWLRGFLRRRRHQRNNRVSNYRYLRRQSALRRWRRSARRSNVNSTWQAVSLRGSGSKSPSPRTRHGTRRQINS
jgi:hypothetical protein